MADGTPLVLPVVIDATRDPEALVPDEFRAVQWTRLPDGAPTPQFVERVKKLLTPEISAGGERLMRAQEDGSGQTTPRQKHPRRWLAPAFVALAAAIALAIWQPWKSKNTPPPAATIAASASEPKPALAAPLAPDQKSVAVLAFANMNADKDTEHFSDGISEELLNVLAKVPGLRVAARTSAFFFKGKQVSIKQVGAELGVAYVIEGSVRKAGDKVRITAQLIKADDGFHVWSDNFDRDLKDIFAVRDEIAGLIAKQLSLKLRASSTASTAAVKPEALELYLRARQAWNLRTSQGNTQADEALNRAIALAPNFAQAYALLAQVWTGRNRTGGLIGQFGQRTSPNFTPIQSQIDRALALEPNLAEAHTAQGSLNWQH